MSPGAISDYPLQTVWERRILSDFNNLNAGHYLRDRYDEVLFCHIEEAKPRIVHTTWSLHKFRNYFPEVTIKGES